MASGLRAGFSTGACAAAAAKAAAGLLLGVYAPGTPEVEIALLTEPARRVRMKLRLLELAGDAAVASVIKDAGDDPDVTNGAEIVATVSRSDAAGITITGGSGVGRVTRPGLPVRVGQPAINPGPARMIRESMAELGAGACLRVEIAVTNGQELAKKTLNARLGIVGGLSILGTTGEVKPLSAEAWTATVASGMSVARALGRDAIALSSGRTSERAMQRLLGAPPDDPGFVLMGDYVEFSLREARHQGFSRVHIAAQWAKMLKIAQGTPDTHVRAGALGMDSAAAFLRSLGIRLPERDFNTAREMFTYIEQDGDLMLVCRKAAAYAMSVSGLRCASHLVSYEGDIIISAGN